MVHNGAVLAVVRVGDAGDSLYAIWYGLSFCPLVTALFRANGNHCPGVCGECGACEAEVLHARNLVAIFYRPCAGIQEFGGRANVKTLLL